MSEKKRKITSQDGEQPGKKLQTTSVRVTHVTGPDAAKPVVASSPGVNFPDVEYQSFVNTTGAKTDLLLHSSEHATLDHTAQENNSSIEKHLKHYIAVFDPDTGKLQVTEAKRVTVRSALRSAAPNREGEDEYAAVTNYTSRAALTAAFGTKKSKKAVQSMAENRLLAQGNEGADNPLSVAMLSNLKEEDVSNDISLSDMLSNKPLPTANLRTNEIDQVYSLDALVHPSPAAAALEMMPIGTWIARISAKKEVKARFRFVAHRVGYLIPDPSASDPKLTKALQVLRYIHLMLEVHTYVTRLPKRRPIPPMDKWPENTILEGTTMSLIRPIVNHFFPDRINKEHSVTLLRTTILALSLHIPPPSRNAGKNVLVTEPTDISLDMAIGANEVRKLYRELGCKIVSATEADLTKWELKKLVKRKKDEAGNLLPKPMFAKLMFPLDFPKVSRGRPSAQR